MHLAIASVRSPRRRRIRSIGRGRCRIPAGSATIHNQDNHSAGLAVPSLPRSRIGSGGRSGKDPSENGVLFNPSLIWFPFGKRRATDITFPLAPTFETHGIDFIHGEATQLDIAGKKVVTSAGTYGYDYLVIATGYRNDYAVVPGLGPSGNAH